jgi:hypothetical protein
VLERGGILLVGAATLCVAGMIASGRYTFAGGWRTAAGSDCRARPGCSAAALPFGG